LDEIYGRLDITTCVNLVISKALKAETALIDFFKIFENVAAEKRMDKSEYNLNENQELDFLMLNYYNLKDTTYAYLSDLPDCRVLVGPNTDKSLAEGSSNEPLNKSKRLLTLVLYTQKFPAFHMTYENFDPVTGIRVCRTFFLTNMQKLYRNYNITQTIETYTSKAYDDCFFLFNLYHIIIMFFKQVQERLILRKADISTMKLALLEGLNKFITNQYHKDTSYNNFIKEKDIIINHNEYQILNKTLDRDTQNVTLLRIEVRNIHSVITGNKIGGLVYADSFLVSSDDIFNLTQDILPIKFFYTSALHLSDGADYKPLQLVRSSSIDKYLDIDIKGLVFYRNNYNIPYLFPDSSEYGLDSNQLFTSLNGKLHIYQDYIVIHDNSLGYIILDKDNIAELQFKDEGKFLILIVKAVNGDYLPLSDVMKNELLLYIPVGTISKIKNIKNELLDYIKISYGNRFKSLEEMKEGEYDLAIRTINENENEMLNYMSNTFNLTNIADSMNDMVETEYLSLLKGTNLKLDDYRNLVASFSVEKNSNRKTKLIFMCGSRLADIEIFSHSLREIGQSTSNPCVIIEPSIVFINDEMNLVKFYTDQIKDDKNKNRILLINFINEPNVVDFIFKIIENIQNFYDNFEILNICFCLNYKFIQKSKNKEIYNTVYSIPNEYLITNIFIDDSGIIDEKVEKYNKLISLMNVGAKIWNRRSFIHSKKELTKIFENTNDYQKILQFYADFKMDQGIPNKAEEELFIPLKYLIERPVFEEFFKNGFNQPIKHFKSRITFKKNSDNIEEGDENKTDITVSNDITTMSQSIKSNMTDEEFETELISNVMKLKLTASEPIIERVTGFVCFKEDVDKQKRTIYEVKANYKYLNLIETNFQVNKSEIGLILGGRNLAKNKSFLEEVVHMLSGALPSFKPYRDRSTVTQKEIEKLNNINFNREIPTGWSVEVPIFIDPEEKRHNFHPSKI
jgi:hypothetical protein